MVEITKDTIEEVTKEGLVLVDFHATWCAPCKMMAPHFYAAEKMLEGTAKLYKADISDFDPDSLEKYKVMGVPTLVLFKDGEMVDSKTGFRHKEAIIDMVKEKM